MKIRENSPGALRKYTLSDDDTFNLLTLLEDQYNTLNFDTLANVFGEQFLLFMDMFAGETFDVPLRTEVAKLIRLVWSCTYVKSHESDPDAYVKASEIYKVPVDEIQYAEEKIKAALRFSP